MRAAGLIPGEREGDRSSIHDPARRRRVSLRICSRDSWNVSWLMVYLGRGARRPVGREAVARSYSKSLGILAKATSVASLTFASASFSNADILLRASRFWQIIVET